MKHAGLVFSFVRDGEGRTNPFWDTMSDTGYFNYDHKIDAADMIQNRYQSPFRFFMAVLFPFPTEDPTHLIDFFVTMNNIQNLFF